MNPNFYVHLFMLQSFVVDNSFAFDFNGVAWSVSNEMFFYFAFIFFISVSKKKRGYFTLALWLVIFLNAIFVGPNCVIWNWLLYINPIFRLGDFLLGMLSCDLYEKGILAPKKENNATLFEILSILILGVFIVFASKGYIRYDIKLNAYERILKKHHLLDETEKLMDDWKDQAVVLPEIADDEELPFKERRLS